MDPTNTSDACEGKLDDFGTFVLTRLGFSRAFRDRVMVFRWLDGGVVDVECGVEDFEWARIQCPMFVIAELQLNRVVTV